MNPAPAPSGSAFLKVVLWSTVLVSLANLVLLKLSNGVLFGAMALNGPGLASHGYWRLVTYMWLHGGLLHLTLNMMGLWMFGRPVAERIGAAHTAGIYLGGGVLGGLAWWAFNHQSFGSVIGASGGVFALVLAFATFYPRHRLLVFPLPMPVEARWAALGFFGVSVMASFDSGAGIAHLAHLGGIVVGFIYARVLMARERRAVPPLPGAARETSGATVFVSREVDAILDKISREGFQSLTPKEKQVLAAAQRKL